MDWSSLLTSNRLRRPPRPSQPGRSPFLQDFDLIVFSSAFRRLAHKTQVHPLTENDHVHTRLTHSIEVASVGRSLGNIVGASVLGATPLPDITPDAFGYIVQAACLAHDIGNPPFGHSGEEAIGTWFADYLAANPNRADAFTPRQRGDLENFEGNAQGLRIITQLENYKWDGGLRLTHAVLGTFMKYPCSSLDADRAAGYVGRKKNGLYDSELAYAEEIAAATGLDRIGEGRAWKRHPLAFLVEAADDICYAIIDIEDGYALGYLTYEEAESILRPMTGGETDPALEPWEAISKYRGQAIGALVQAAGNVFIEREAEFLAGSFNQEILDATEFAGHIKAAKVMAREKLFHSERKTKLEIAGNEIIRGLLDFYHPVVEALEDAGWDGEALSGNVKRLHRLVQPYGFKGVSSPYEAWLRVTDYISGMTDRYALDLYRKLKGISI